MNIGRAAEASGVSAKMIRYYESTGLVRPAARRESGYRDFGPADVEALTFIRRARSLGFPMPEITRLMELWRDRSRPSREVKAIALRHVAELDARAADLQAMAESLRALAAGCAGDEGSDCAILAGLAR